jgi:hypothetical protein
MVLLICEDEKVRKEIEKECEGVGICTVLAPTSDDNVRRSLRGDRQLQCVIIHVDFDQWRDAIHFRGTLAYLVNALRPGARVCLIGQRLLAEKMEHKLSLFRKNIEDFAVVIDGRESSLAKELDRYRLVSQPVSVQ